MNNAIADELPSSPSPRKWGHPNFNPRYLEKTFSKIIADSGLPPIHMHDLRHSSASILLSMGINIKIIQQLLGHSNISITLDTYSHLLPSMQDDAVNMWDNLFKKEDE